MTKGIGFGSLRMSFPLFYIPVFCHSRGSENPVLSVIPAEAGIQAYSHIIL